MFEKLDRLRLADALELVGLLRIALAVLHRLVQDRPADLRGERVVQAVDQIADVVGDVAQVQAVAAAIAGIENLLEVFGRGDDRLVIRQRAVAQVADAADLGVRVDDPLGQDRQVFFQSKVGGHGNGMLARGARQNQAGIERCVTACGFATPAGDSCGDKQPFDWRSGQFVIGFGWCARVLSPGDVP